MEPRLEPIKNGWAAIGDSWAVHGATQEEALEKFQLALKRHREIDQENKKSVAERTPVGFYHPNTGREKRQILMKLNHIQRCLNSEPLNQIDGLWWNRAKIGIESVISDIKSSVVNQE